MLDGLQALLTRQRSLFLVFLFLSRLPAAHLLLLHPPPQTFERPFAPRPHVSFLCQRNRRGAINLLPGTFYRSRERLPSTKKGRRDILDREKTTWAVFLLLLLLLLFHVELSLTSFGLARPRYGIEYPLAKVCPRTATGHCNATCRFNSND